MVPDRLCSRSKPPCSSGRPRPAASPPRPHPHPHPRAPAHTGPPVLDQRAGRAGPRVGRAPESSPRRGAAERAPDGADSLRGTVAPLLRTCSAPGTRTPCPCACVPRACGSGPWAHGDGRGAAPGKGPARPQARRASERRASEPRGPGQPPSSGRPGSTSSLEDGLRGRPRAHGRAAKTATTASLPKASTAPSEPAAPATRGRPPAGTDGPPPSSRRPPAACARSLCPLPGRQRGPCRPGRCC